MMPVLSSAVACKIEYQNYEPYYSNTNDCISSAQKRSSHLQAHDDAL